MKKLVMSTIVLGILSGCNKVPYFPEPFGNVSYEYSNEEDRVVHKKPPSSLSNDNTLFRSISNNPNPIVDTTTIARYRANQDYYLAQFASMNQFAYAADVQNSKTILDILPLTEMENVAECRQDGEVVQCLHLYGSEWQEVAMNGINYVDAVCQDYLRQIYRLQKNTNGLKGLNDSIGRTTEAIIGFTSPESAAAIKAINIIGAAFGLSSNVFDIYKSSVLINIDFRALHSMVKRYHSALIGEYKDNIDSRSKAVKFIQDYLYLCSPPAIEAAINAQVGGELGPDELVAAGISESSE